MYDYFEIYADPYINARCPKHHNDMKELRNGGFGWFNSCWYCEECKYLYTLKIVKMPNVNKEELKKALEKQSQIKSK